MKLPSSLEFHQIEIKCISNESRVEREMKIQFPSVHFDISKIANDFLPKVRVFFDEARASLGGFARSAEKTLSRHRDNRMELFAGHVHRGIRPIGGDLRPWPRFKTISLLTHVVDEEISPVGYPLPINRNPSTPSLNS